MNMVKWMKLAAHIGASILIAGAALGEPAISAVKMAADPQHCAALLQESGAALGEPTARILTATLNARSEPRVDPAAPPWMGPVPAMPEHCEVIGVMRERTGAERRLFRLPRLPALGQISVMRVLVTSMGVTSMGVTSLGMTAVGVLRGVAHGDDPTSALP